MLHCVTSRGASGLVVVICMLCNDAISDIDGLVYVFVLVSAAGRSQCQSSGFGDLTIN